MNTPDSSNVPRLIGFPPRIVIGLGMLGDEIPANFVQAIDLSKFVLYFSVHFASGTFA